MSHNVFANNWQIAAKSGMNKSIARFPDVCLSPPSPPAGPIPVPYPDTSFSTALKKGSKQVKLGRKPAALAQQSFYKVSLLGNEAATRSFGASVVTRQSTGKTYFQAWSMDVKFEGKNVCRHIDITTSNHGSAPGATPPAPSLETQTLAEAQDAVDNGKCPCCGEPLHAWQKDDQGNAFTPIKEDDFWQKKINQIADPNTKRRTQQSFDDMKAKKAASRARDPGCPNVHKDPEKGCAVYFDIPHDAKSEYWSKTDKKMKTDTPAKVAKRSFKDGEKAIAMTAWQSLNPGEIPASTTLDHKTPRMAGGCNNPSNVVPHNYVEDEEDCKSIEGAQSTLENINVLI